MFSGFSGEPTQIYRSNTNLRTPPPSQNGQDGLTVTGEGGCGKNDGGDTEEQYRVR